MKMNPMLKVNQLSVIKALVIAKSPWVRRVRFRFGLGSRFLVGLSKENQVRVSNFYVKTNLLVRSRYSSVIESPVLDDRTFVEITSLCVNHLIKFNSTKTHF